ncbi:MAG: hypothetical protein ACI9P5_003476 [Saprospiraceae bacterium]|mgnify:CR=1 FL=1|jgi:hypothetical protein
MKYHLKNHIMATLLLSILLLACNKDELQPDPVSEEVETESLKQIFDLSFSSEGSLSSSIKFIVLSDLNGEAIYDTIGSELDVSISLSLDTGAVVNATVGFITEEQFSIVSYSDLKSGSEIDLSRDWETDTCFQSGPVDRSRATLYITDVAKFYETINPINDSNSDPLLLNGDTLILEGWASSLLSDANYQVAIREQEGTQLKSIVIPRQDWNWDNETQSMNHIVSFNDFTSTIEHKIELERNDEWRIKVKVCDKDGRYITTQRETYFSNLQNEESVTVFLNEAIDVSKIKLNIAGNNISSGYSYNWIHNSIPQNLDFDTNNDPVFTKLDIKEFHILNTFNYNLNVLTYEYGGRHNWTIISKGGQNVKFIKPDLPNQLYETFSSLNDQINNPVSIINTMYRIEGAIDDVTKVHKSVIPRNKNNDPDFNYSSKETRIYF